MPLQVLDYVGTGTCMRPNALCLELAADEIARFRQFIFLYRMLLDVT